MEAGAKSLRKRCLRVPEFLRTAKSPAPGSKLNSTSHSPSLANSAKQLLRRKEALHDRALLLYSRCTSAGAYGNRVPLSWFRANASGRRSSSATMRKVVFVLIQKSDLIMAPPPSCYAESIESYDLALHPGTKLWVSLHCHVPNPQELFPTLRSHPNLAMVDASSLVSMSQLVVAANMALARKSKNLAWDTVLGMAATTHSGHVMRDYAFGPDSVTQQEASVIVLAVGGTQKDFANDMEKVGLKCWQPVSPFFNRQMSPEQIDEFYRWYGVTSAEVQMSTLEQAVLTRISTKFYL